MEGFEKRTFKNLIKNIGSAKIFKEGFYEKEEILPLQKNINDYDRITKEIKNLYPEANLSPQIRVFAYLNKEDKNLIAYGFGIKPYEKEDVFPVYKFIKDSIIKGRFLKDNNDKGIIVDKFCAKKLNLKLKDKIIILTTDLYNSFNAVELELIGITDAAFFSSQNQGFFIIDLNSAQKLLGLEGKTIELIAMIPDEKNVDEFGKIINKVTKKYNLEFISWKEILGVISKLMDLAEMFMWIIYFIFILISSVGITNTVLISVFERLRDFGTLRALGFTKGEIFKIIVVELGIIGFIFSVLGILISLPFIYYFSIHGIYIRGYGKDIAPWLGEYVYLDFSFKRMFYTFIIGSIIPVISGIYPLVVTNRITVRELMGYI